MSLIKKLNQFNKKLFAIGLLSLTWYLLRSGTKPSRTIYPCQQTAKTTTEIWLSTFIFPIIASMQRKKVEFNKRIPEGIVVLAIVFVAITSFSIFNSLNPNSPIDGDNEPKDNSTVVIFPLKGWTTVSSPASNIYAVNGTTGNNAGFEALIDLMGSHGLPLYKSINGAKNSGPEGLIAKNDVIIIKVNCQWNQRGGTNTDLLRKIIEAIIKHPDGFTGEIVVADNGQAQYGSGGNGGSLNWAQSNAEDHTQSIQKVVDSLSSKVKISTYLWDTITTLRVKEYSEADTVDGYIVNETRDPDTGVMVSYPKFKTKYGTYISFKLGVWNQDNKTYDSDKLKVINVPVLKTHGNYGVTASIKHYMGVPSDKLTSQLGARTHNLIRQGGMATLMVETRFPTLNIIDAIWVNASPMSGPSTSYEKATRLNVIAAGTDPVALDYWASKYILLKYYTDKYKVDSPTMNPDISQSQTFGIYLRESMNELNRHGYQTTIEEIHMNVYVTQVSSSTIEIK